MFEKIGKNTSMLRTDERVCGTIYLIEEGGKRLIIDSGDGDAEIGFAPDICILTHGHFDHTSGVEENWPCVLLHPAEAAFKGPYLKIPKNAAPNPMKPLTFGSHLLEFFHTPGHTRGSICILDRKTGILFSGDTAFAGGGYGRTDLGGNEKEMEESLGLISKINYKLLCPGHGDIEKREE